MKLRNKKTGEIVEAESCNSATGMIGLFYESKDSQSATKDCFETLAELNEDWEDYKPAEPLIKDEKIRKAVRAWAEANNIRAVYYSPDKQGFYVKNFDDEIVAAIYFGDTPMEEYEYDWNYTIAELCGEEEE